MIDLAKFAVLAGAALYAVSYFCIRLAQEIARREFQSSYRKGLQKGGPRTQGTPHPRRTP